MTIARPPGLHRHWRHLLRGRLAVAFASTFAATLAAVVAATSSAPAGAGVQGSVVASPALVVETVRGTFEVEMFPREAPVTVSHVLALVKAGFYDGQRVHRALPGFVVQFGDPQTRNESLRHLWGRGTGAGSGTPVGVAEISTSRRHRRGAVSLAHMGVPARAESQMFIALDERPDLDGRYAIFGTVSVNPEVPAQLQVGDLIVRISARD